MKAQENTLPLNIFKSLRVRDLDKDPEQSLGLRRAGSSELWCVELARKRGGLPWMEEGKVDISESFVELFMKGLGYQITRRFKQQSFLCLWLFGWAQVSIFLLFLFNTHLLNVYCLSLH